jgi:dTDP-4-amino-4,6-dideoxygalactose transaminase
MIQISKPYFSPESRREILSNISRILESGQLMLGPFAAQLEREFAAKHNIRHAVSVNSCTTALQVCLEFAGARGHEVLVPAAAFTTDLSVVRWVGAKPVLVDIDPETLSFDLRDLERKAGTQARAIIWIHLTGVISPQWAEIVQFAQRRGLFLIEDCAHAHGAEIDGRAAGTIGDAGCFSFFPTKLMTCGAGGIITTHRPELDVFAREMRLFGRSIESGDVVREGNDWFLDEFRACIACAQLNDFAAMLGRRRAIAARYDETLANQPGLRLMGLPDRSRPAYYQYPVFLDDRLQATEVAAALAANHGIQAKRIYRPVHQEAIFREYDDGSLRNTERVLLSSLCLPMHPGVSDEQADLVASALIAEVRKRLL